jgi:hypothetical protein
MDYYQESSPLCDMDNGWYGQPATSFDQIHDYVKEEDYNSVPSLSHNYPDFQEPLEDYNSPGPMKRPVRSAAGKNPYTRMYSPSPSEESVKTKIGRPNKATSTSKMADYARNYRATKKEESKLLVDRNRELIAENKNLITQNKALKLHLQNLEKEMVSLRSVMNKDNQIAAIVASIGGGSPSQTPSEGGVCLHISGGRVQIEICETCNQRVRDRAVACRQAREDPLLCQQPSHGLSDFF